MTLACPTILILPQETIDTIVDFVAVEGSPTYHRQGLESRYQAPTLSPEVRETLENLSLASPVFARTRAHLFKVFRVSLGDGFEFLEGALELFSGSPYLTKYIRIVDLVLDFGKGEDGVVCFTKRAQNLLARIFAQFGRLESLEISHFPSTLEGNGYSVAWGDVRKVLRKALRRMVVVRSADTLKRVKLVGFRGFPLGDFLALRGLEELVLPNPNTTIDHGALPVAESADLVPWNLRYLALGTEFDLFDSLFAAGVCERLTDLTLVIGTLEMRDAAFDIIGQAAQSLVALKLEYIPRQGGANLIMDCSSEHQFSERGALPPCPRLRHILFSIHGQQESARTAYNPFVPHTIPGLLYAVMRDTPFPALETFNAVADLQWSFDQWPDDEDMSSLVFAMEGCGPWAKLDDAFSSRERVPSLSAMGLRVHVELVDLEGQPVDEEDEVVEWGEGMEEWVNRRVEEDLLKVMGRTRGRLALGPAV